MKVLVDSLVWIDYFRNGNNTLLDRLLNEDLVVINDIILTELVPALTIQNQKEVIDSLENIECIPLNVDWEVIRAYQIENLRNGINRVGIPDLIILHQVIEYNLTLFSLDKHFSIMQKLYDFKVL